MHTDGHRAAACFPRLRSLILAAVAAATSAGATEEPILALKGQGQIERDLGHAGANNEPRFARTDLFDNPTDDQVLRNRPEKSAVLRSVAVVAKYYKVIFGRQYGEVGGVARPVSRNRDLAPVEFLGRVLNWTDDPVDVRVDGRAINDAAIVDLFDLVARKSDHSLLHA